MPRLPGPLLPICLLALPVAAQEAPTAVALPAAPTLTDPELAAITGKFVLPNGVSLALSVTSDTVVNGQLILRTVFTLDDAAKVSVLGRLAPSQQPDYALPVGKTGQATPDMPTGVEVAFDRRSGTQTITPTYTAAAPTVTTGSNAASAAATASAAGLSELPVAVGGPAVQTWDGTVALGALRNGTQVTLAGDQLDVSHLVGSAIATSIANTANDRTIDSVTNVNIDLRDAMPLTMGSAALRIDGLVSDVARGMIR